MRRKNVQIQINPKLYKDLESFCESENLDINLFIEEAVASKLNHEKEVKRRRETPFSEMGVCLF